MNWKLYFILVVPAAIIMLVLGFLVPIPYKFLVAMVVPAVFWILYYSINYVQHRKKNRNQNNDS